MGPELCHSSVLSAAQAASRPLKGAWLPCAFTLQYRKFHSHANRQVPAGHGHQGCSRLVRQVGDRAAHNEARLLPALGKVPGAQLPAQGRADQQAVAGVQGQACDCRGVGIEWWGALGCRTGQRPAAATGRHNWRQHLMWAPPDQLAQASQKHAAQHG